ncbi:alpha/beta fold hydrolase [Nonomuraea endophytica]|uniref:Pimeloyl-ACP methyl ester carboxylesterase n=1 Tax=Nonomuraea endophytica TaxID=714136 RepID=A0A7W8AD83_9ACTN|nr:alpha/beta fold hydrolase [Nonomuraea endophytica]MBB5084037.1 pimeloyl-ACP methyl ester carboxylesterase [Nonomuraea endophytica]
MVVHVLGLTLAASLLTATPPAPPTGLHECATATTRCDGSIDVPLDWDDPSSERITVAFAFVPAKDADGTVVANLGGPGPSVPMLPYAQQALGPVLERKNLLMMDPRGLGKSSPLQCPGVSLLTPEKIAACAERVGPRGAHFTADQASHDLDAVRKALGLGRTSFYGNSYGALYAQAYAARYPSSLDAIFLDSSLLIGSDGYTSWKNYFLSLIRNLGIPCERSKACAALPGRPSGIWTRLVERLRERPDPDATIFQSFALMNRNNPVFGRESVAAAHAYLRGDKAPLHRLARPLPKTLPPMEDPSFAGYLAFRCGDGTFPFDRDASPAKRRAQAERYYERNRPLGAYRITDVFPAIGSLEPCVDWPTPRHSPPRPPGQALPSVPVLVMAGELDIETPADVARTIKAFPYATVVTVPFGGHNLAGTPGPMGDCARAVLRTFLTTKQVAAQGCTAENYRALGRFPQRLADVAPHPAAKLTTTQRRIIAAAFATAADATARRNPNAGPPTGPSQPGLRGGQITFGTDITLDNVRHVEDLPVTGPITLTPEGRATATLHAETSGRTHRITLTWEAFTLDTKVSGTYDGIPFG